MLLSCFKIQYSFVDLIFEDAMLVFSNQLLENIKLCLWKWEASSKNNADTCVVRWQQLGASVLFFYLLTGMLLIAFVEKLMP